MKRTATLRRTRLSPVSKKRAKQNRTYAAKRRMFLIDHPICEVWLANNNLTLADGETTSKLSCAPWSVDIHHKAGRNGANFLDTSTWMAVSREAHDWIHAHPKDARARGWLI